MKNKVTGGGEMENCNTEEWGTPPGKARNREQRVIYGPI